MGNCVRKHQKSALKFRWSIGSKAANLPSEINNVVHWEKEIGRLCSSPLSPHFSEGEEVFFDSNPWLDSDTEDFFSVNGDNTPSCGSTPVRQFDHSPKEAKKQLIELFRDSFNEDQRRSAANPVDLQVDVEPSDVTRRSRSVKGKSAQSTPCCIPNLARSLSLGDRKKRLSPYHGGGGVAL